MAALSLLLAEPELVAVSVVPGGAGDLALEGTARGGPVGDGVGDRAGRGVRRGRLWR